MFLLHVKSGYIFERSTVTLADGSVAHTRELVWSVQAYRAAVYKYITDLRTGALYYYWDSGAKALYLPLLKDSWFNSLRLFVYTFVGGGVLGVLVGCLVALRHRVVDTITLSFTVAGLALPDFLVVLFGQFITIWSWRTYDVKLWSVLADPNTPGGWTLPLFSLSLLPLVYAARITATAMDEVMNEDYIRTARSKGLRETKVILKHALGNALPRILSGLPLVLNTILSSLVIVERLTNWPGLGKWLGGQPAILTHIGSNGTTTTVAIGPTPGIVSTAAFVFILWYLLVDGAAQSLRMWFQARTGEVQR